MKESPESLFEKFLKASTCKTTLQTFQSLCNACNLSYPPVRGNSYEHISFYRRLKESLSGYWKAQSLFTKLDKRYNDEINLTKRKNSRDGQERVAKDLNVLIIGAGPCGLRTAIFSALLGAKTVVVEKRDSFSRNNVLHLWPFTIEDLKALGAKRFNGRFCSGAIDHVSIRQLQLILMKACLIFGVEIHVNTAFVDLCPPNVEDATLWTAKFDPETSSVNEFGFHMIVGADGRKNTLKGFEKKAFRGSLAIGITVNFINKHTAAEARVQEISGINFIYRQEFFRGLNMKHKIDLENIVYYKDDTHYFVMTARKQSLLERGVLRENFDDPKELVHSNNIDQKALLEYALDAVNFSTENKLPDLEVAINNYGLPDIALFDFTCMKSSVNASMFREVNGVKLLKALVGDGLMEPFWPKGTGIAKGFLAAYDTSWMLRRWAMERLQDRSNDRSLELSLLAERESLYRILPQIESINLVQNYPAFSLDPKTRYQYAPKRLTVGQISSFYVSDDKENLSVSTVETDSKPKDIVPSRLTRNISFVRSRKLQQWCEKILRDAGSQVLVTNMNSSWKDGRALCSIINYYRPDLLDLGQLKDDDPEFNNQLAFDVAEEQLGVTPIMSGKEMADNETVDELVMVTYLSQFYEIFKNDTPVQPVGRVSDVIPTPKEDTLPKSTKKKTSPLGILTKVKQQFKRKTGQLGSVKEYDLKSTDTKRRKKAKNDELASENDVILTKATQPDIPAENKENTVVMRSQTPGVHKNATNRISALGQQLLSQWEQNSDLPVKKVGRSVNLKSSNSSVCFFCGKTVYIVERLSVEGLFFHRQCFKCTHCDTILRPLNYKRDDDTGKFYCSVHYFANAKYLKSKFDQDEQENLVNTDGASKVPEAVKFSADLDDEDDEFEISIPTIERGQVVMRKDLTPKRSDMQQMSFSISSNHIEIEEEALNEHNMRCSINSEMEDVFDSDSEEDEDWDKMASQMTAFSKQTPEEMMRRYKQQNTIDEDDDAAFLSSTEDSNELSSISSSSVDDTALMNKLIEEETDAKSASSSPSSDEYADVLEDVKEEAKKATSEEENRLLDEVSLSSISSDSNKKEILIDDEFLDAEDNLDLVSLNPEDKEKNPVSNLKMKDSHSHSDDISNEDGAVSTSVNLVRKDTLERAENHIISNPVNGKESSSESDSDSSSSESSLSSSSMSVSSSNHDRISRSPQLNREDSLEMAENHIKHHPVAKPRNITSKKTLQTVEVDGISSASSVEVMDINKNEYTEVEVTDVCSDRTASVIDNTSVWVASLDEPVQPPQPEAVMEVTELSPAQENMTIEQSVNMLITSTPNTSMLTPVASNHPSPSPTEVFVTPCAQSELDDTFYSVKSDQSSQEISPYISKDSMNGTLVSDKSILAESSSIVSKMTTPTGGQISETPKPKPKRKLPVIPYLEALSPSKSDRLPQKSHSTGGRRKLPMIPHLEALTTNTEQISPKQKERIEKKLKKHEDRVMERIQKIRLGSDVTLVNGANGDNDKTQEENNDFVSQVPLLLQRRNNAIRKKKPRILPMVGQSENWLRSSSRKSEKKPSEIVPAKILSPRNRSSRRREMSSYTQEEIDYKISYRVQLAAEKQAKEAEQKRMSRALVIQSQLQEVDMKRRQLEERGVELEKLLRDQKSHGVRPRDSSLHMHEWFKLVQEKNALLRYENELMIHQRELQLEDKQSRLQRDFRERMTIDDSKKTKSDKDREQEILTELMDIVEQRDQLVALLDEHRVQDQEESSDIQKVLRQRFSSNAQDLGPL